MYKFKNGLVCYDEETRDKYLKSGMKLVEEPKEEKEVEHKDNNEKSSREHREMRENSRPFRG